MQVRHRGIEREEGIERQRRRLAVEHQRLVAAQLHPVGIADRRDRREAVERAAQDDGEHARIAPFGARELRQERPGEQHAGSGEQFAACRGMEASWHHLLWNSGAISASVSACWRLSARAMVLPRLVRGERPERGLDERVRLDRAPARARRCGWRCRAAARARRSTPPARRRKPFGAGGRHRRSPR